MQTESAQASPRTSHLCLSAFHHPLNRKKNEEIPCQRDVEPPLQSISQNFLTCEEQRSVTCKSVVNCHDLHSELKKETGKLGCEIG